MTSRRLAAVLGVLVVSVLLTGCVALEDPERETDDPDPEAVFEGAYVHSEDLEDLRGVRRVEMTDGNRTVTEVLRIERRPYVDERSEVVEASDPVVVGNLYVSNATDNWLYYSDANVTQHFEAPDGFDSEAVRSSRAEMAANVSSLYDLEYRGTDRVADREAHVLAVEAKNETVERDVSLIVGNTEFVYPLETGDPTDEIDVVEQRLWIDTEYDYPLKERLVYETPSGDRYELRMEYESISFNVGLEDERFAFEPPENTTVEEW
ncbi:LolA family protein [Natrinema sp. CGMCC1.2065]|uniref:LolA family protein n=1 Tax=Natrinema sp. CGMCC1.2065 TaxID=3445767 RepID=UPI003F49DB9B